MSAFPNENPATNPAYQPGPQVHPPQVTTTTPSHPFPAPPLAPQPQAPQPPEPPFDPTTATPTPPPVFQSPGPAAPPPPAAPPTARAFNFAAKWGQAPEDSRFLVCVVSCELAGHQQPRAEFPLTLEPEDRNRCGAFPSHLSRVKAAETTLALCHDLQRNGIHCDVDEALIQAMSSPNGAQAPCIASWERLEAFMRGRAKAVEVNAFGSAPQDALQPQAPQQPVYPQQEVAQPVSPQTPPATQTFGGPFADLAGTSGHEFMAPQGGGAPPTR